MTTPTPEAEKALPEISPEAFIHCSKTHLDKLFREAKSEDLTQAQFEHDKTERIKALSAALVSVASEDNRMVDSQIRSAVYSLLERACADQWEFYRNES
jgi:hypothetical protein